MLSTRFGIEIEFTGITRQKAAAVAAQYFGVTAYASDRPKVIDTEGRVWKFTYDGSIAAERRIRGEIAEASDRYKVELVSPILTYRKDIKTLQELVRDLRKAGGRANNTCGVHIHLDGANHTPRSLWNFVNLIASRNDLFYKALQIPPERMRYCQKMDAYLVARLNSKKPKTFKQLEDIWYAGYDDEESRTRHYHTSRYHFLNLHSFFHGHHTVELRGFNGTLHAGKIRAYIVFALAMNHQALTQKYVRYKKVQSENEKFAMRVYLVRIGLSGVEFKNCRQHLYQHLDGNAAWRYGSRENCHSRRT